MLGIIASNAAFPKGEKRPRNGPSLSEGRVARRRRRFAGWRGDSDGSESAALLSRIAIGSRVEVYWPADESYHPCVVVDRDVAGAIHTLRYENGAVERIDLTWEKFRLPGGTDSAKRPTDAIVGPGDDKGTGALSPTEESEPEPPSAPASPRVDLTYAMTRAASDVSETINNDALLAGIAVGSRLEVYRPADGKYHACVVTDRDSAGAIHTLRYDDGTAETIDLTWEVFRPGPDAMSPPREPPVCTVPTPSTANNDETGLPTVPSLEPRAAPASPGTHPTTPCAVATAASDSAETIDNEALLARIAAGARLEVYWPADGKYHACVVANCDSAGGIHALRYDDGTAETIDLTWEVFRMSSDDGDPTGDIEEGGAGGSTGPDEGGNAPVVSVDGGGNSESQIELEDASGTTPEADASEGRKAGDDHVAVDKDAPVGPDDDQEQILPHT